MARLLVISSSPARLVDGKPYMDKKFCEGMRLYCDLWGSDVSSILRLQKDSFPFGQIYNPEELPFELVLISEDHVVDADDVRAADVVLCSGDSHLYFHLADLCDRLSIKLVFIIEYIFETRRQIIFLDHTKSFPKKIYSLLWTFRQERRRQRAFRMADGLQANGYPAFAAYRPLQPNTMMYLDNRIKTNLLATPAEMVARRKRLESGARLRIIHSGRLENLKGSNDLVPIAQQLAQNGVDFELHIFGTGSLEEGIRDAVMQAGLHTRVHLHGAVDFETELVPFARTHADIYLSCHRQSDPSCTYIESMGCGLAIAGYANRMWSRMHKESQAGWLAPMGDYKELSRALISADSSRKDIVEKCDRAYEMAAAHTFEKEFGRRIQQLKELV